MTPASNKDTIYIDNEDDITTIIDKVGSSKSKIVALVLPKRSTTLQSIVNLRLLKRTADSSKKNLVLVTSDPNVLPLAGAVKLHVAKTPLSKPAIPHDPSSQDSPDIDDDSFVATDLDGQAPIGVLADAASAEETIELDNDSDTPDDSADKSSTSKDKSKKDKTQKGTNKKLKVPDFDRFKLIFFGVIALVILLIVGYIYAFNVLPKAKITIKTDSASVTTDVNITAKTGIATADVDNSVIPGYLKTIKKTDTEKVAATGQRDDGAKATGKVTLHVTDCAQFVVTIPAGTTVTANGLNFITQSDSTLNTRREGPDCTNDTYPKSFDTVSVVASNAGDKYNLGAQTYAVAGFSNITGKGSATTGGTSKMTQIVSQADIDSAKQKILDRLNASATADLKSQFSADNTTALTDTLSTDEPVIASTPNVNDPGSDVTVSLSANYSQMGVKSDDLKKIVEADAKKHIDTSKQAISDDGLGNAIFRVSDKSATSASFSLQTIVKAGPQLDANDIKKQVAGKKKGYLVDMLQSRPGITEVDVKYSPFWVHSTPKNVKHITVIIDKPNGK